MFPSIVTILVFILITILIAIIGFLLPRKTGNVIESVLVIVVLVYLFTVYSFMEAMMIMSFAATAYSNFGMLLNKDKRKSYRELKQNLKISNREVIHQEKSAKRLIIDFLLTFFVSLGALVFFLLAPDTYMLLKFFIGLGLITVLIQMIDRVGTFLTTSFYWLPDEERLVIISVFQSRNYPLTDLKEANTESTPDLLRLHPLFTFLSVNQDYTTSFQPVIKLSFPGEDVYLSPVEIDDWQDKFKSYTVDEQNEQRVKVLPFWHPKSLKRLFWKGYFAATVKGVSAYTGLLFILIWLEAPSYMIIIFVLFWWMFNLYISDRLLIAGTDATKLTTGELFERAQHIFKRAEIPQTSLYIIDSPIHNGFATGMNIGRGTIMLTKATTQLSVDAVEAILAHEAIHIKKRDVLINQMARMLFLGLVAGSVYLFFDQIVLLAENLYVFIPLIYLLMIFFPLYLSFVGQWTEMRADHLGASLLEGGTNQMGSSLWELGNAQDQDTDKSAEYSLVTENRLKLTPANERDKWFLRFLEFQLQAHPPLYFRIECLTEKTKWKIVRNKWLFARVTESIPDRFKKGSLNN